MRRILITVMLSAAVSGLATGEACEGENGNPEFTPDGAWILFTSTRDGNSEVYRMRPDGSGVANLSNHPAEDLHPVALPDQSGIIFDSNRDGDFEVYLANDDGTDPRAVTDNEFTDLVARPSPDGSTILFNSMARGQWDIYHLPLTAGVAPRLFEASDETEILRDWPSHGAFIPFDSDRDTGNGRRQLYVRWMDGRVTRLTDNAFDDRFARRGPPGTSKIAFTSNRGGDRDIWLINADGSGLNEIVAWQGAEQFPSWSPDGRDLVFAATRNGSRQIYRMDTNSGKAVRLTGCKE